MNVISNHAHALYGYGALKFKDYLNLFRNAVEAKFEGYLSLNVHLPFEIQHPQIYPGFDQGLRFINLGEKLKRLFKIKLYWENAPAQNNKIWTLRHGQTDWVKVPGNIELCLDTGHLILGARTIGEARARIEKVLTERGQQIKHLHLHENDLAHDTHEQIGKVIDKKLLAKLTKNRTYIFEKGVPQENW